MEKDRKNLNTVSFEKEFLDAADICINRVLNISNPAELNRVSNEYVDLQSRLIAYLEDLPINKRDTKWPLALKRKLSHLANSLNDKETELKPEKRDTSVKEKQNNRKNPDYACKSSSGEEKKRDGNEKEIISKNTEKINKTADDVLPLKEEIRILKDTVEELSRKLRDTNRYLLNLESQLGRRFNEVLGENGEKLLARLELIDKSFLFEVVRKLTEVMMKNFPTYDYYRKVRMFGSSSQILAEIGMKIGRVVSEDTAGTWETDIEQLPDELRNFSLKLDELARKYRLNKKLPDLKTFIASEMETDITPDVDFKKYVMEKYVEQIDRILNGEQISENFPEDYLKLLRDYFPRRLILFRDQAEKNSETETFFSGISDRIQELYGVLGLEEILMPLAGVWDDRTHSPDLSAWEVDNRMDNVMVTEVIVPGLQTVETGINGKKTVIQRAKVKVKGPESFRQYVK
jgi:hypothetical protein